MNRRTSALAALCVAACVRPDTEPSRADAPVDSAAGEVAFELVGPNDAALTVPVRVNGTGPYTFVLDTGATLTCLDQELRQELGLEEEPMMPAVGVGIGGAGDIDIVRIDSLSIGQATLHDLAACALDLSAIQALGQEVRGLLGLNALKPFRVVLDFERGVVQFGVAGEE